MRRLIQVSSGPPGFYVFHFENCSWLNSSRECDCGLFGAQTWAKREFIRREYGYDGEDTPVADDMYQFEKSGARRSKLAPRYDLIPMEGLRRLADRYQLGLKYGKDNWKKGITDPEFVDQAKCHMYEHMLLYLRDGCVDDDNLAAIAWGCMTLMEAETRKHDTKPDNDRPAVRGNRETAGNTRTD